MKEALSQVLGLLIIVALVSQITVDRLPVSLEQQIHQGSILVVSRLDILDQRPVSREEYLSGSPHICLVMVSGHARTLKIHFRPPCLTMQEIEGILSDINISMGSRTEIFLRFFLKSAQHLRFFLD